MLQPPEVEENPEASTEHEDVDIDLDGFCWFSNYHI